jgi:hypothetical protein
MPPSDECLEGATIRVFAQLRPTNSTARCSIKKETAMIKVNLPIAAIGLAVGLAFGAGNAFADAAQTIVDQCNTQALLDMPEKCECMGNMARTDLSEQQQELVAARMTDDAGTADGLVAEMSADDVAVADQFVDNTSATCEQP